jgi:archaeosortase B (VPXXXP-CTERM-specific)
MSRKINIPLDKNKLKFILVFFVTLAILYYSSVFLEDQIPIFNMVSTSRTLNGFLQMLNFDTTREGNMIHFEKFSFHIIRQCTGVFEIIAIASCIIAFPSKIYDKVLGILLAIPIIYFFNLGRLLFLSYLGLYYPTFFDVGHDYLLQLSFIILVILYWMFWIDQVSKDEK